MESGVVGGECFGTYDDSEVKNSWEVTDESILNGT
jgi:hypothetical protein